MLLKASEKWRATLDMSGGGNQSKTQKNQEAQSTTFSPMSLGVYSVGSG